MSDRVKIYLAGTIYKVEPGLSWKKGLIHELCPLNKWGEFHVESNKYNFFDPDPINEPFNYCIARDKQEIEYCDIFVAYIEHPTFGTSMEILHAFNQQSIPVLIINPSMNYQNDLWLKYHSHLIVPTVRDCAIHIESIRF